MSIIQALDLLQALTSQFAGFDGILVPRVLYAEATGPFHKLAGQIAQLRHTCLGAHFNRPVAQ